MLNDEQCSGPTPQTDEFSVLSKMACLTASRRRARKVWLSWAGRACLRRAVKLQPNNLSADCLDNLIVNFAKNCKGGRLLRPMQTKKTSARMLGLNSMGQYVRELTRLSG